MTGTSESGEPSLKPQRLDRIQKDEIRPSLPMEAVVTSDDWQQSGLCQQLVRLSPEPVSGPGNNLLRTCLSLAALHFRVNAGGKGFPPADAQSQIPPHVVNDRLLKTMTQFPLLKSCFNMAIGDPSSMCKPIPIVFRQRWSMVAQKDYVTQGSLPDKLTEHLLCQVSKGPGNKITKNAECL